MTTDFGRDTISGNPANALTASPEDPSVDPCLEDACRLRSEDLAAAHDALRSLAENLRGALPCPLLDAADECPEFLRIPSIEEMIVNPEKALGALDALMKKAGRSSVDSDTLADFDRLREAAVYIAAISEDLSGTPDPQQEPMARAATCKALEQNCRVFCLLSPSLGRIASRIKLPERKEVKEREKAEAGPPPAPPDEALNHAAETSDARGAYIHASDLPRIALLLLWRALSCLARNLVALLRRIRSGIQNAFRIKEKGDGGGESGSLSLSEGNERKESLFMAEALEKNRKSGRNRQRNKSRKKADKKKSGKKRFDGRRNRDRKTNLPFVSRDATEAWRSLSGSDNALGEITSTDPGFSKLLSVVRVDVMVRPSGEHRELGAFIQGLPKAPAARLDSLLFRRRILRADGASIDEDLRFTQITLPVIAGDTAIPMPAGYTIAALKFLDKNGEQLHAGEDFEVRECVLGSARLNIPEDADEISYTILPDPQHFRCSPEEYRRLAGVFPRFTSFPGAAQVSFRRAIGLMGLDPSRRADFLFRRMSGDRFRYSDDPLVMGFLRMSGTGFPEALWGMELGTCDPFSFLVASELMQSEVPGFVISGLSVGKDGDSFVTTSGHAQCAALTPDGARIFDLTCPAEQYEGTGAALPLFFKIRFLRGVRRLTFESVFESGIALRESLDNCVRMNRTFLGFLKALFGDMASGWQQKRERRAHLYGENGGDRGLGGAPLSPPIDEKEYQFAEALALRIAFEAELALAREERDPRRAMYFYDRHYAKMPETEDLLQTHRFRERLPEPERWRLCRPAEECMVEYMSECLADRWLPEWDYAACADWVAARLPVEERFNRDPSRFRELGVLDVVQPDARFLDMRRASVLIACIIPEKLQPWEAKKLCFGGICLMEATHRSGLSYRDSTGQEVRDAVSLVEPLSRITMRLEAAGMEFSLDEKKAVVKASTFIAGAVLSDPNRQISPGDTAAVGMLSQITGSICMAGEDQRIDAVYDLASPMGNKFKIDFSHFSANTGERRFFLAPRDPEETSVLNRHLGRAVTAHFCATPVHRQYPERWDQVLSFFARLGFDLPGAVPATPLLQHINQDLVELAEEDQVVNFPDEQHPASLVLCTTGDRLRPRDTYRVAKKISEFGIFSTEELRENWITVPESHVCGKLLGSLDWQTGTEGLMLTSHYWKARSKDPVLRITRFPVIVRMIAADNVCALAAHDFLMFQRENPGWLNDAFMRMQRDYPASWQEAFDNDQWKEGTWRPSDPAADEFGDVLVFKEDLCAAVSCDISRHLNADWTCSEIYMDVLWYLSCCADGKGTHEAKQFASELREMLAGPEPDSEELESLLERHYPEDPATTQALGPIPIGRKVAALLSVSQVEYNGGAFSHYHHYRNKIGKPLLDVVLEARRNWLPGKSKEKINRVWERLFESQSGSWLELTLDLDEVRRRSTALSRKVRAPFARFVNERAGRVIVDSASGDFRDLREYNDHDDIRVIDWRASSRSDRLYVREYETVEGRPIAVFCDLKHLLSGIEEYATEVTVTNGPLADLFMLLRFAEAEGREVNVECFGRTHFRSFKQAVSRTQSGHYIFDEDAFRGDLEGLLSTVRGIYDQERTVFGNEGFPPVNIFAEANGSVERDKINIFLLAPENVPLCLPFVQKLRKCGQVAAVMKPG